MFCLAVLARSRVFGTNPMKLMKTKLFIVLGATILGAVITGCNHQPEESNGGATTNNPPPMVDTNLMNTNSVGAVNVPSVSTTNNVPMTETNK
jgi:hypothetical protein